MVMTVASEKVEISNTAPPVLPIRTASCGFITALLASVIVFWVPLHRLLEFAANSEYSYIPIIPAISAFLIFMRKSSIFRDSELCPSIGSVIAGFGILLFSLVSFFPVVTPANRLSLTTFAIVATWWGLFVLCYGMQAARMAMLPLCLLLFMIPAPERATSAVIHFLQHGSAVLSYYLFRAIGVAAFRDGTTIALPGLQIEVAPQCSGIRSSISLLILTLAGANLYLRSGWNKVLLVSMLVPLAILKNAIRIVTLSTLALYVDRSFLTGSLHHEGGILFFLIALVILIPIVLVIQSFERRCVVRRMRTAASPPDHALPSEAPSTSVPQHDKSCAPLTSSSMMFSTELARSPAQAVTNCKQKDI
jgi:exosortase